ncbi:helix-turn-helix domain-containing protein [Aquimarina spinulae]|uniref:helix-turn-helix domain-containing protein n=1 Tax=Aquimarina spinulae TaxID=1192023 RepID=UPI000D558A24|nr:helix-turn-helix domain-containing protein [Aquimarina spinulae]
MIFKEYKIPSSNNDYIVSVYFIECNTSMEDKFYVPDGNLELMLVNEPVSILSGENKILTNEKHIFWGQKRFTGTIEANNHFKVFGIKFQPWLFAFIKEQKNIDLVDSVLPLNEIMSKPLIKKINQFFKHWNFSDPRLVSIDNLSFALKKEFNSCIVIKPRFKNIITELRNKKGICSIADLQYMYMQSERTLEYDFKKYIGITAKEYQNIVRFRKSCMNLKTTKTIIHTALDYGYYDQAHFTNYFTKYCQRSPSKFLNQGNLLLSTV